MHYAYMENIQVFYKNEVTQNNIVFYHHTVLSASAFGPANCWTEALKKQEIPLKSFALRFGEQKPGQTRADCHVL